MWTELGFGFVKLVAVAELGNMLSFSVSTVYARVFMLSSAG